MQVPQEREQRVRLGVAVRDMAKAAGIRINVERVPFASYAASIAGKAQMYVDGYFARPTIDTALYPFYHSTGSWNRQLWLYTNARVDELLDLARKTNDEAKRKAIFDEFQKVVEDTVPSIIPYSAAARQRRAQGGRGLPHHAHAVAGAERGQPQALSAEARLGGAAPLTLRDAMMFTSCEPRWPPSPLWGGVGRWGYPAGPMAATWQAASSNRS